MQIAKIAPPIAPEFLKEEKFKEFTLVEFEVIGFYKNKFYTIESEPLKITEVLKTKFPQFFVKESKIHITIKEKVEVADEMDNLWLEQNSEYKFLSNDQTSTKYTEVPIAPSN